MIRAIPARILRQILLVIVLRVEEWRRFANLGGDGTAMGRGQRFLEDAPGVFCREALLLIEREYGRAVLAADIVALSHTLRGIVRFPERAQQVLIVDLLWIEHHEYRFGMAGLA